MNSEAHIGIFWYHEGHLLFHAEPALKAPSTEGFADVDISHYEYWEVLQSKNPKLKVYEYEDIPRGRVVMQSKGAEFIAYSSEALIQNESFRDTLIEQFKLPQKNVRFIQDSHYEDPETIDWED
ncbi:MAG: hypothetical protein NWS71_00225 [Opitutales bacterium]|jgi:hypothetical protein|nr:hypothetical protein [Opitutales bacterium]